MWEGREGEPLELAKEAGEVRGLGEARWLMVRCVNRQRTPLKRGKQGSDGVGSVVNLCPGCCMRTHLGG